MVEWVYKHCKKLTGLTVSNYMYKALHKHFFGVKLFQEISWYTLGQIIVQVVAFFSAVIVTRYLGPINLGLYSFVQNYVGTILTVIGGADFYFTWKIAKSKNYIEDVLECFGYKLYLYITLACIGTFFAWLVLPNDIAGMISIMLIPVFIQSLNAFSFYVLATNRAKLMAVTQTLSAIALLIIKIGLVSLHAPLYMFVVVSALDLILSGIIFTVYFIRFNEWRSAFKVYTFPSFIKVYTFLYSIRFSIIALIFWQLLQRIDQLILATFSNAYTLGIYSAAVKVAEVPNFLAGILSAALISRLAYVATNYDEESKRKLSKIMSSYLVAGVAIAFSLVVLAPFAVHVLYGSKFADSVFVLRAYALSIPAMFMNYFFLGVYGAKERQKYQIGIFGAAVVVNVVLVYVLTPLFGLTGTAYATVVAYTVAAFGFYIVLDYKK